MKKLITLAISGLTLIACSNQTQTQSQTEEKSAEVTEKATPTESFKVQKFTATKTIDGNNVKCVGTCEIDFPVSGDAQLVKSVKEYIYSYCNSPYKENQEGQAFADEVANISAQGLDGEGMEEDAEFSSTTKLTKQFENDAYVTYSALSSEYTGGVHGNYGISGATFDKTTGKKITNFLKNDGWDNIQDQVAKALCKYFMVNEIEDLKDQLDNFDYDPATKKFKIEQSSTEPFIDNDTLIFLYQPYEIACYAAGAPEVKIALKDIKAQLSDETSKFVK